MSTDAARPLRLAGWALLVALLASPAAAIDAPARSDEALRAELASTCRAAKAESRPMLVEFAADWCSDCRVLDAMKREPDLADEIARWPMVVVDVGEFDRHEALLRALDVHAIARWVVLTPTDCNAPAESWPIAAARTLEPASGQDRKTTPADLAAWLQSHR